MTPSPDSTAPEAEATPCPFCNGTNLDCGNFQRNDWHVTCRTCGFHNGHHQSQESAWLHWNTRATRQESGEDSKIVAWLREHWPQYVAIAERHVSDPAMSRKEGGGE